MPGGTVAAVEVVFARAGAGRPTASAPPRSRREAIGNSPRCPTGRAAAAVNAGRALGLDMPHLASGRPVFVDWPFSRDCRQTQGTGSTVSTGTLADGYVNAANAPS